MLQSKQSPVFPQPIYEPVATLSILQELKAMSQQYDVCDFGMLPPNGILFAPSSVIMTVLRRCLQRALDISREKKPIIERLLLSNIMHAAKSPNQAQALSDIRLACSCIV